MEGIKVILDRQKLNDCKTYKLGVLVTLKRAVPSDEPPPPIVVVGQCACITAVNPITELVSLALPTPNWAETVNFAKSHFPSGCDVGVGVWVWVDNKLEGYAKSAGEIWKALSSNTNIKEAVSPSIFVTVTTTTTTDQCEVECFRIDSAVSALDSQSINLVDVTLKDYLNENTALLRLCAQLPLDIPQDKDVLSALSPLKDLVKASSTVFYVPMKHLIFNEDSSVNTTIRNLLRPFGGKTNPGKSKEIPSLPPGGAQHMAHQLLSPISVEILTDSSLLSGSVDTPSLALSIPLPAPCVKMIIPVDVLGLFPLDLPMSEVAASLRDRVLDHLGAVAKGISWKEGGVCNVTVHHIPLVNQHCPVTIVYPHTPYLWEEPEQATPLTTDDLRPLREQLHERFCLGNDMPYFRVPRILDSNQDSVWISSNARLNPGPQLLNPHSHIKHTIKDDSQVVVRGNYLYYHYMQNGFNDDGWGCAYRSLQTLWSWFLLQGYTDKLPPLHREIQETLVAVGDKEPSFIGSKEWIGSFEVSTCLSQLLQVDSKIHNCSSGADMANMGRVLTEHFKTQGTPVMIGGGVLAHTILGISFNAMTGEVQFLILDPHYTGREDIKTITDKGKWCGWKPVSFWKPSAQYNLCMPQRPDSVI